jgi:hypothetical protein
MKTEEDEAFDDLARRQGMWGGGFPAKRAMSADKLLEDATRSCNNIDEQRALDALMREAQPAHCQCFACRDGVLHWSDCAVHNGPAYPAGPCDCGVEKEQEEDWGALAEKQLASIKRDTQAGFEDAVVRATHKVMAEFEAQPAQEPVAWITPDGEGFRIRFSAPTIDVPLGWDALYTAPPKREWVGLTDEEREDIAQDYSLTGLGYQSPFKSIEAKLKEKNT